MVYWKEKYFLKNIFLEEIKKNITQKLYCNWNSFITREALQWKYLVCEMFADIISWSRIGREQNKMNANKTVTKYKQHKE